MAIRQGNQNIDPCYMPGRSCSGTWYDRRIPNDASVEAPANGCGKIQRIKMPYYEGPRRRFFGRIDDSRSNKEGP